MPKKQKKQYSRLAEELVHVVNVLIGLCNDGEYNTKKFQTEYSKFDRMTKLIALPESTPQEIGERLVLAEEICELACDLAFVKIQPGSLANCKQEFKQKLTEWRDKRS